MKSIQKKSQSYSSEFKESAVKLAKESDQSIAATARELGVNINTLHTWIQKYRPEDQTPARQVDDLHLYDQLKVLKKENARLKAYRKKPNEKKRRALEKTFDKIFQQRTCFETLNSALKRLHKNKAGLLLVLERPEIPLHNNASESDIREQVKRRKISGGTRSDLGQQSRDTFISVKKTCRKLGISFWAYLLYRVSMTNQIKPLPDLMREKALTLPGYL